MSDEIRPLSSCSGSAVRRTSAASGFSAAVMMIMVGVFQAIQGVVALFNDTFYVVGEEWVFSFDITTWGWIHLVMGVIVVAAGFFVLQGTVWARSVGVAVAAISAVLNLCGCRIPRVEPADHRAECFVIWALIAHGREVAR